MIQNPLTRLKMSNNRFMALQKFEMNKIFDKILK